MNHNFEKEIWQPIKGYEGYYEISNYGRIKRLEKILEQKNGVIRKYKEQIRVPKSTRNTYPTVSLNKDSQSRKYLVHILVAQTFLSNPHKKQYVNHKDGNKTNYRANNLEWCTQQENIRHAFATGLAKPTNNKRKKNTRSDYELKNEIWRDIEEYNGIYQVSDYGRIRRNDSHISKNKGGRRFWKGRILEPVHRDKTYYVISLSKDGKRIQHTIHRLVAKAFLPNPNSKPNVNHKNGIKTDNRVENLEWSTVAENTQHAVDSGLMTNLRKVNQYDLDGNLIKSYISVTSASDQTGVTISNIRACCLRETRYAGEFQWRFDGEESDVEAIDKYRKIKQFSLKGVYIQTFDNANLAVEYLKRNGYELARHGNIFNSCLYIYQEAYGFQWRYDEDNTPVGIVKSKTVSVVQISKKGKYIQTFNSIQEAERYLQENQGMKDYKGNISHCCKCEYNSIYGYIWMYEEDYIKGMLSERIIDKDIIQLTQKCEFIRKYSCFDEIRELYPDDFPKLDKIMRCCRNEQKTAYGYIWLYSEVYEKLCRENNIKSLAVLNGRYESVVQLGKSNEFIARYETIELAVFEVAGDSKNGIKSIMRVCNGERKTAYGFRWMYEI